MAGVGPFKVPILQSSTVILGPNASRASIEGLKHTGSQYPIYLGFGTAAVAGQGVRLLPNQELPHWIVFTYQGQINGIAVGGTTDTISGYEN